MRRQSRTGTMLVAMVLAAIATSIGLLSGCSSSGVPDPVQAAVAAPAGKATVPKEGIVPTYIAIDSLNVHASVGKVNVDAANKLQTPTDFKLAAWYEGGTKPGAVGPAVIVGHVDSKSGPAVFYHLKDIKYGATITVAAANGAKVDFKVTRVQQAPKNDFPSDDVYNMTKDSQLRLITCGGSFNGGTGHYVDNVIVYATKA